MSFSQWLFGGIDNPYKAGQWGPLHIATLVTCAVLILGFRYLAAHAGNQERTKKRILCTLVGSILFLEIMIRFVNCVGPYVQGQPPLDGATLLSSLLPRPWCAIACWSLIASMIVKKAFFYNFASLSALLCAIVFFIYPGVGYNNVYLLFDNWYSILTHALLLVTSTVMMVFKYTVFYYRHFWKMALCFALTFVYAFMEIFVLKPHADPLYFMPHGDIQEDILRLSYGVYLFGYILLIIVYINVPYLISDREAVKRLFLKHEEVKE